ncbi:MAG: acyltransferase family protein [Prevotella sp.]|nr:acyltransferase family protein [Prevotella sp.]
MSVKERDVAVDWVKFFAVFIIINSHADKMYPHFQILATGGAVGDCLFLFCSGFTLFLGQKTDFGTYYKRRISRIYPTVFMAVIFDHLIRMNYQVSLCEFMGRVFIRAIMIYYVFLFFIREYAIDRVKTIVGIVALITLIVYFCGSRINMRQV